VMALRARTRWAAVPVATAVRVVPVAHSRAEAERVAREVTGARVLMALQPLSVDVLFRRRRRLAAIAQFR